MRIALVNPITRRAEGYHTVGSLIPQLGLQVLARLVPDGHEVELIDECFGTSQTEALIERGNYDLVGCTGYTSGATRAYEIADACRRMGIKTIMGGPHASAVPDEAARHFDSVAVGECDSIWPEIVRDAAAGRLKAGYRGRLDDLEDTGFGTGSQTLRPINGRYDVSALQTSRGCPVGCEYCSVTKFNGAPIRRRRIEDIVQEWNETPRKFIFVVDDNFFGVGEKHAVWAKELLRQIIRRGRKRLWFSQTTLNMGADAEGLELAYKAGCRGMLIGFESFNPATLKQYAKGINRKNLNRYQEMVNGFHKAGISVFGGFIIGSDEDTPETVADTAKLAVELGVDIIQITNLTPLPGTKMYDRYRESGRLFAESYPGDWERYTFTETVFNPARMTAQELDEAIYELRYAAAQSRWVWKRALRTLWRTRSLTTAGFVLGMNQGWKRMARVQAPRDAQLFTYPPRPSPRMDKIWSAFRMHLNSTVDFDKLEDRFPAATGARPDATPLGLPVLPGGGAGAGS